MLRWHLEHNITVIPKSAQPDRIAANFDLLGFSLTADEVATIDAMAARLGRYLYQVIQPQPLLPTASLRRLADPQPPPSNRPLTSAPNRPPGPARLTAR